MGPIQPCRPPAAHRQQAGNLRSRRLLIPSPSRISGPADSTTRIYGPPGLRGVPPKERRSAAAARSAGAPPGAQSAASRSTCPSELGGRVPRSPDTARCRLNEAEAERLRRRRTLEGRERHKQRRRRRDGEFGRKRRIYQKKKKEEREGRRKRRMGRGGGRTSERGVAKPWLRTAGRRGGRRSGRGGGGIRERRGGAVYAVAGGASEGAVHFAPRRAVGPGSMSGARGQDGSDGFARPGGRAPRGAAPQFASPTRKRRRRRRLWRDRLRIADYPPICRYVE